MSEPQMDPLDRWEYSEDEIWDGFVSTRAALQQAEEALAEAWKEARDIGDDIDITADNLPALICGIGDKYRERLTKADEALVIDQRRIGQIFMEREDVKQRLAQTEAVARELLAALGNTMEVLEDPFLHPIIRRATAMLGEPTDSAQPAAQSDPA